MGAKSVAGSYGNRGYRVFITAWLLVARKVASPTAGVRWKACAATVLPAPATFSGTAWEWSYRLVQDATDGIGDTDDGGRNHQPERAVREAFLRGCGGRQERGAGIARRVGVWGFPMRLQA
jgi:hypothetical protein